METSPVIPRIETLLIPQISTKDPPKKALAPTKQPSAPANVTINPRQEPAPVNKVYTAQIPRSERFTDIPLQLSKPWNYNIRKPKTKLKSMQRPVCRRRAMQEFQLAMKVWLIHDDERKRDEEEKKDREEQKRDEEEAGSS